MGLGLQAHRSLGCASQSYVHDGDDEIVPETEVQDIADEEQIEQRQVDVDQSSLGYNSCRHFVYSFLIYVTCVVSYFF